MMKRSLTIRAILALAGGCGVAASALAFASTPPVPPPATDPVEPEPAQVEPASADEPETSAFQSPPVSEEAPDEAVSDDADATPAEPAEPPAPRLDRLAIGDAAPPMSIEAWVKGEPVGGFQPGRVYLVEFWATWCAPCIDGIPKLTSLQSRFADRGLTVIAISSSEQNGLEDVQNFVRERGQSMGYTVAWDRNGMTDKAWMRASGQAGIPTAFIVDQEGLLAWIGHPTYPKGQMERVLEEVLSGTYDVQAAAQRERKAAQIINRATKAWSDGERRQALDMLVELMDLDPRSYAAAGIQRFQGLFMHLDDADAAHQWGQQLVSSYFKYDAEMLRELAWSITMAPAHDRRHLDLAHEAIVRADELTSGRDVSVLDTMARVHFLRNEPHEAVECQQRAISLNSNEDHRRALEIRLEEYHKAAEKQ